jgi:hypothetical protein
MYKNIKIYRTEMFPVVLYGRGTLVLCSGKNVHLEGGIGEFFSKLLQK